MNSRAAKNILIFHCRRTSDLYFDLLFINYSIQLICQDVIHFCYFFTFPTQSSDSHKILSHFKVHLGRRPCHPFGALSYEFVSTDASIFCSNVI